MTKDNEAKVVLVSKLKTTINVISLFESRVEAFREELNFFTTQSKILSENSNNKCSQEESDYFSLLLISGLRRLDHEVMFLCIDTYALHESISMKESLYSKYIASLGKLILSIDKTPSDPNIYLFPPEWDEDMKKRFIENDYKEDLQQRKKFRNNQGITANPKDKLGEVLDKWKESLVAQQSIKKISEDRGHLAHRLQKVHQHDQVFSASNPDTIKERIDCIAVLLDQYKIGLQTLLSHLTLEYYEGMDFIYDSLSRLRLVQEYENNNQS